ncbi:protein of unknown function (DUF3328) domain containing protein [Rhypophila sp. PSN 637]
MSKTTNEYQLLYEQDDVSTAGPSSCPHTREPKSTSSTIYVCILHLTIAVLFGFIVFNTNISPYSSPSWSPIQGHLKYNISSENALGHHHSIYSGPPTVSLEQAWDHLMKRAYFRATKEELERAGETIHDAVELPDNRYLASISAYHELHCLRQLRFHLYRTHYYPNLTKPQETYLQGHLDHCIEMLRITIMCHGNPALMTFTWKGASSPVKPATKSSARAICVDWESMESWGQLRQSTNNIHVRRQPGEAHDDEVVDNDTSGVYH